MPPDLPLWLGFSFQMTGVSLLFFTGGLGNYRRFLSPRWVVPGFAFFGSGCVSLVIFAVSERHLLLAVAQCLAMILVLGGYHKTKGRNGGL